MARVAVDLALPHLDRPFDYTVPQSMDQAAQPGVRVRVRFAGQDVDGYLLERLDTSDHAGRLSPIRRVVSPVPVLTPQVLRLARAVADRYAGTLSDVLRLAVPPRHAATEKAAAADPAPPPGPPSPPSAPLSPNPGPWAEYPAGGAFVNRLAAGQAPRAVWTALPGPRWAEAIAEAVATVTAAGRSSLVVLPDRRDVDAVEVALLAVLGPGRHVRLEADLGPAARYAAFLSALRGQARVVVGTRAAAYAPVPDLGLVVIWDDGDDQHAEQRAPYPHAREVLALRCEQSSAAMLIGGWSVSAEAARWVASGWARPLEADRALRRHRWPRVVVAGDDDRRHDNGPAALARIDPSAWRAIQQGLTRGPVLVQVPRRGYLPAVACQSCRRPARCPHCAGPIRVAQAPSSTTDCGWCGRTLPDWQCPYCHGRRLRAALVGVQRTAEELGRAFPSAQVVLSRAERHLPTVPDRPALVLSTPGVEPVAAAGYAAAVLLDGDLLLSRPDLRAGEDALRRWRAAAALVRSHDQGGVVVVAADPAAPAVQALVRGDPAGYAARELAERGELALPPTIVAVTVVGAPDAVAGLVAAADLPASATVLGPVPIEALGGRPGVDRGPQVRTLIRAPHADASALARALQAAAAGRSARREGSAVRIQVDARDLG